MDSCRHDDDNKSRKNILDVLNADCWRHVLDYVEINDVVRSERVSRRWQQVVLGYLPGVKSYLIHDLSWCGYFQHYSNKEQYRCMYLEWDKVMYQSMINKMGPYMKKLLVYNSNFNNLSPSFGAQCPNIEDITFYKINWEIPFETLRYFKRLKKVTFLYCTRANTFYLDNRNIISNLDEFFEHGRFIKLIPGSFLAVDGKNLTSLTINECPKWKIEGLDKSENFSRLKELVLNFNSPEMFAKVSQLLRKTPKLEILSLNGYKAVSVHEELVAAIGRLGELQRFSMSGIATDALLDAIANGCKKLRYLNVNGSHAVSGRAVRTLCRELPCISELCVARSQVADEDLAHCISYGSITALDVSFCSRVSPALVAAAARDVRRRPRKLFLRLRGTGTASNTDEDLYEEKRLGLTLTWKSYEHEQNSNQMKYKRKLI